MNHNRRSRVGIFIHIQKLLDYLRKFLSYIILLSGKREKNFMKNDFDSYSPQSEQQALALEEKEKIVVSYIE